MIIRGHKNDMIMKKIASHVFNGRYWSGWSNRNGSKNLRSIRHASNIVARFPEIGFYIIDGDKSTVWVSCPKYIKKALETAKLFFGVKIKKIIIGYPKLKKCYGLTKTCS